ncbi:MAG TPA: Wzz/FepE/Etk N-terminal domain-containing protein [Verrucomicrobiae bacterium]
MNNARNIEQPSSLSLADIYFVVFRHKWKIAILTVLGLAAAAAFYFKAQPPFQSQAEILIRYVVNTSPVNPTDNNSQVIAFNQNENIIKAEVSLLNLDLFEEVATNVGPDKILAKLGGGNDPIVAASTIQNNFKVTIDGSVLQLTYQNPDPTVVGRVLEAIVVAYQDKSDQVHRAIDISTDSLMEQTASLRQQISQTDEELRMAKASVNIIDVADADRFYSDEMSSIRVQILKAEADLSAREVSFNTLTAADTNSFATEQPVPPDQLDKYKTACATLNYLRKKENNYLYQLGYTEENRLVKDVRDQMTDPIKIKTGLEAKYPSLAAMGFSMPNSTSTDDSSAGYTTSAIDVASLPARIKTLQGQLAQIQAEAVKLGDVETKIADLERKRKILEDNYTQYANTQEEENIKQSLGPGRNSNIPQIMSPTPPSKDFSKFYKVFYGMMFSGLILGLAWAFLVEFYLDRSIKRPIDVQTKLKIPFFLSIPDLNQHSRRGLASAARKQLKYKNGASAENGVAVPAKDGKLEVMAWEVNRRFDSYYDALRDRLVVYFESINLTRKPKLVAVTSTHKGAGVSTIASGLASSLSETGDGRVLLVDMNLENGAAQQFFRGKPSCKLDDALESEKRNNALVQENLYVVIEDIISDRLPRALPKRFASLVPKLKASDYDYIIFDMPPVSPTSVTSRLAGFMDTVMLVIESEKTDQQVVQQANALLAQSKASVTVVLNKTRQYIPSRLHRDFLSDV